MSPRASLARVARRLALSSAALGPLLDAYHSAFGVLAYAHPLRPLPGVESAAFVPPLFAFAGVAIGGGALLVDRVFPPPVPAPSFPRTFVVIAAFSGLYYVSGVLASSCFPQIGPVLWGLALLEWAAFDRSVGAAALGIAAAAAGWGVEAAFVNFTDLYRYSAPEVMGLPLWIIPCYFAGGPAVASLARSFSVIEPDSQSIAERNER